MTSDWHFFKTITNPVWLKSARPYYFAALPLFVLPAAIFTIASIGVHLANTFATAQFSQSEVALPNLLMAAAVFFAAFCVGAPLLIFAVVKWMFSISAFTRFWLDGSLSEADGAAIAARKENALATIKGRQKYLTAYWLYCSVFTLIPAFVAMFFLTLKGYSVYQPQYFDPSLLKLIDFVLLPLGCLLGAFCLVSSFVTVPVSVIEATSAKESAWSALRLTFRFFAQTLICALILCAIHTAVDNPELLYKPSGWQSAFNPEPNLVKAVFTEIWQGLTSVVFVPLSLVPLCEMLRNVVDESDKVGVSQQ